MNWYDKVAEFLLFRLPERPVAYGEFHLMMFGIVILISIVLCATCKNCSDKAFRRIIFWYWLFNLISELYVALVFTFKMVDGVPIWSYDWYMFPFQFCSSPAYTLIFIALLKDGKARDAFIAFSGSFAIFAGLAVMVYPGDVFINVVGLNIQTMIHHGMMVGLGIFMLIHERRRLTHKYFLRGINVFVGLLTIAMILNIGGHHIFESLGRNDTFNMYYISPYHPCTLPILSIVREMVPYPVFLVIYIVGFSLVAALMYYIVRAIIIKTTGIAPHTLKVNCDRPLYHERVKADRNEK